ncbi:hypothetical protein TSAR_003762 [Trichomalopsis sarcophagae]|uniref:Uncharacterized protein n=1 Tax=Trichomalopsis sarcophagae TaxID=543379 RepID=A0A232ELT8_9HYME|nr:hypothetical protein TSAR_003762 [Trichomalopsis sarcophagae]
MSINRHYFNSCRADEGRRIRNLARSRFSEEEGDESIVRKLLKEGGFETEDTSGTSKMPSWLALAFKKGSRRCAIIRNFLMFESDPNDKVAPSETIFYALLQGEDATCRMVIEYVARIQAKTNKHTFNNERSRTVIDKDSKMRKYYEQCQAELKAMKSRRIGDTIITFLGLLTKPVEVLTRHLRNEDFLKHFNADGDYETSFPIYAALLRRKVKAATARQKIIEQFCIVLSTMLPFPDPSHKAYETIAQYMSDADMKFLIGTKRA